MRHTGRCIFCPNENLSGEHLWPKWAADVLGNKNYRGKRDEVYVVQTRKDGHVLSKKTKRRNGPTSHKRLFVVCEDCNNTWMSQIEKAAKPIVLPLMQGDLIDLNADMQRVLAEWACLKILVADNNERRDPVFREQHLRAFKAGRVIPQFMSVWVGRTVDKSFKNIFYKQATIFGLPGAPRPVGTTKNTQATTIGVGELIIHSLSCTNEAICLSQFVQYGPGLVRLWPIRDDPLVWPPMRILSAAQVSNIATVLDELIAHPNVIFKE